MLVQSCVAGLAGLAGFAGSAGLCGHGLDELRGIGFHVFALHQSAARHDDQCRQPGLLAGDKRDVVQPGVVAHSQAHACQHHSEASDSRHQPRRLVDQLAQTYQLGRHDHQCVDIAITANIDRCDVHVDAKQAVHVLQLAQLIYIVNSVVSVGLVGFVVCIDIVWLVWLV